MAHETKPTLWDASICATCGFAFDLHPALYGFAATPGEIRDA